MLAELYSAFGGAGAVHMVSQDEELLAREHDMTRRLARGCFLPHHADLAFPLLDDSALAASRRWGPDVLPALVALDAGGAELGRATGWIRSAWQALAATVAAALSIPVPTVDWAAFPEKLEGCGSKANFDEPAGLHELASRRVSIGEEDDLFEFMADAGFGDGLPVVPPTPERVARMLKGTVRDPAEVIARVPPMMGAATVEKVASNAVMAGCKPAYLPVVLAALEAVCTDEFNCHGVSATTMAAAPVMVINGPVPP